MKTRLYVVTLATLFLLASCTPEPKSHERTSLNKVDFYAGFTFFCTNHPPPVEYTREECVDFTNYAESSDLYERYIESNNPTPTP